MLNRDLFDLLSKLHTLSNLKGVKFAYAVNKNIKALKKEVEDLRESIKPSASFEKYQEAYKELHASYAIANEDGTPKVFDEGGKQVNKVSEDKLPEFNAKVKELEAEYADALSEREEQLKEFEKMLGEDADGFEFYKVKLEYVPEDITTEQMSIVMPLVDDE